VYSVGALLWELLTGRRLHDGDNEIGLVRQIAEGHAPSPRTWRADSSAALERIVLKALTGEPAQRYPSAHALQTDLEEYARELKLAVSARTIAALMHELFAQEYEREQLDRDMPPTLPFRLEAVDARAADDLRTPPTATVAPVVAAGEAIVAPDELDDPRPRSWRGLTLALAAGILLGGGGLYAALGREPAVAVEPPAMTSAASTRTSSPATTSTPTTSVATTSVATTSAATTSAATTSAATTPADATTIPSVRKEQPRKRGRSDARKRKAKARRTPAPDRPRELDLDAALPPGTAAR
jgi:serine/threonine-protein kinase